MAKALVTGANGFLGSWLTRALVTSGAETCALVRPNSDLSELAGVDCRLFKGDVTDLESLQTACAEVDVVFHLAGLISYRRADRALMEKVNVQGTANVVQACRGKRLVHMSSVVAIGASFRAGEVLDENSPYNLSSLDLGYFETKRKAESLVLEAARHGVLDAVAVNPTTIYGFGDARKGSRKNQIKVAQGRLPYYPGGGVNVVAAEDVVNGILRAWKQGRTGERYILAGENFTLAEVFAMIAAEAGVPAPSLRLPNFLVHAMGAYGDLRTRLGLKSSFSRDNAFAATMFHWFSSAKAQRELGFKPRPAREAIHNSVQWMREHGMLGK